MARNILLLMVIVGSVYLVLDSVSTTGKNYVGNFVTKNIPAKIGILGV